MGGVEAVLDLLGLTRAGDGESEISSVVAWRGE